MSLTAIVITKDSEDRIGRTLKSVDFADEKIVVVDKDTNDATAEVARQHNATVIMNSWQGYGKQKNFALAQATSDWVLFVDDDEEVPAALQEQILRAIKPTNDNLPTTPYSIYWLRVVTVFLGRPLKHLYGHNPRLFRRDAAQWTEGHVHEQLQEKNGTLVRLGDPQYGLIKESLLHHSHPTIASYLEKMHIYTSLDATQMQKTSKHRSGKPIYQNGLLPYHLATKQGLKMLFYRKGILDGWAGIVWSILSAYYEYEMAKKFLNSKKSVL